MYQDFISNDGLKCRRYLPGGLLANTFQCYAGKGTGPVDEQVPCQQDDMKKCPWICRENVFKSTILTVFNRKKDSLSADLCGENVLIFQRKLL